MKKAIAVILTAVLLLSFAPFAFAAGRVSSFKVNPYGGGADAIDTVSWFAKDGAYFLFLPADADLNTAKLWFDASGSVALDGTVIENGDPAAALTEGAHTLVCGDASYALTVMKSANIPAVYIATESGSLDYLHQSKENKEPGDIRIYENGVLTLDKALKQIKGRGNSTWNYPKKPYNIKFDKKTSPLGMAKAKKWTLLANYFDYSLLHTANAYFYADGFGLPYTSEYRHIDLYINGNYMGNYFLCESVEIGENRVEIADLEDANEDANPDVDLETLPLAGTGADGAVQSGSVKGSRKWAEIPNEPDDVTGGYLLEYEYAGRYNEEPCGFVTSNGQPIVIKSPELASRAEVNYIADYVEAATQALYAPTGYNGAGRHYTEYFDADSLVNMYILQELGMNFDAALSSFYVHKPEGDGKLILAPVWDMDNAFGSRSGKYGITLTDTSVWWSNMMGYHNIPTMLTAAYSHAEFREAVSERWAELRAGDLFARGDAQMKLLRDTIAASAAMNAIRWNHFGTNDPQVAASKWEADANVGINFVQERAAALDRGFGGTRAYLYYDKNGASSDNWGFAVKIAVLGDTLAVKPITGSGTIKAPSGKEFRGWNTKADGTGTTYLPGDAITLTDEYTVLYAQWKDPGAPDEPVPDEPAPDEPAPDEPEQPVQQSFWQRLLAILRRVMEFFRDLFR